MDKPHRKKHDRGYYYHQRRRAIKKKRKIAKGTGWYSTIPGKFNKGKVHCSCSSCSPKTRIWGWKMSDQKNIDSCNEQLKNHETE